MSSECESGVRILTEQEQQAVKHVVTQLVQSFPVERIILFGSRARGEANEDSDYDFLVIMNTDDKPTRRGIAVRQKARLPRIPMDFMVRTPSEWSEGFLLQKEIVSEGNALFERGDKCLAHEGA